MILYYEEKNCMPFRIGKDKKPMGLQFHSLTDFIPAAEKIAEKKDGNTLEGWNKDQIGAHIVDRFVDVFYHWLNSHPEMRLDYYRDILAEYGLSTDTLDRADTSVCDARCILAMIFAAIRAERFSEGFLMTLFSDGSILAWLRRLEELDA